jgi:CTP synthase
VLLCRSEEPLPESERRKIALFTNVPEKAVISAIDVPTIYAIPRWLHKQGLDELAVAHLKLDAKPANLAEWDKVVEAVEHPKHEVDIAIIGKYVEHKDAYKSLSEALRHGGLKQSTQVNLRWVESEEIEAHGAEILRNVDGILVPGGFGKRGFEGKILAAKFARENKIPYFGICYGMHAAVVDFARHIAGLHGANSTENDRLAADPVIALITEWTKSTGEVEHRSEDSDMGGTMRLGAQEAKLKPGTLAREMYGQDVIRERHRHRYEFNNNYRQKFSDLGLVISGASMDDGLVEMIEFPPQKHPWFVAGQFHPEFTSTPRDGHPLFFGFIGAARVQKAVREAPKLAGAAA